MAVNGSFIDALMHKIIPLIGIPLIGTMVFLGSFALHTPAMAEENNDRIMEGSKGRIAERSNDRMAKENKDKKTEGNIDRIQEKLNQNHSLMQSLKEKLNSQQKTESEYQAELLDLEKDLKQKSKELEKIQSQVREKEIKLKNLEETQQTLNLQIEKQQNILAKQIKALYLFKQNNALKMLLNLENPQALDRFLNYYPFLNKVYVSSIQSSLSHLATVSFNQKILNEEHLSLKQLMETREKQLKDIQTLQQKQLSLLQKSQKQMGTVEQQLRIIQEEESQLLARLKGLEETSAQLPSPSPIWRSFSGAKGRLALPIQGASALAMKSALPSTSNGNPVMIQAEPGQEVRAIYHGRVVFAESLRGFGLLMIIDHGGGYLSLYGHNQALYKKVGDAVEAGQLIGRIREASELGNSRLYFEIRKHGKPINLVGWFK